MIIDLSLLVKNEGMVQAVSDEMLDIAEFDYLGEKFSFAKKPVFSGEFVNEGSDVIRFTGICRFTLNVRCALCAKQFTKDYTVRMDEILKDDEGNSLIVNGKLEIDDIIMTDIFLNLELKHLCREDCKGLCSVCGADLNKGDCGCDRTSYDPRLSALRDLLK